MSTTEHATTIRRRAYCAATVRHVEASRDTKMYAWLREELERCSFEYRTTSALRELADAAGVTNLGELDALPNDPEPLHGEYLCPDCHDNWWVPREDGLYVRCLRCNPPEDTDHDEEHPPPHTDRDSF